MKKVLLSVSFLLAGFGLMAQTKPAADTSWKKEYRETATKINNLEKHGSP